tara:strand:+ start:164 stop:499 length:336 start_codon:yes stop_codon:yes gene_type:complete
MSKKKKKKYFPNNWEAIRDAPDEAFSSPSGPLLFKDFMDWKMEGWELPSSVACVIRETNLSTGKVKEYTYAKQGNAKNKIDSIIAEGKSEFLVCDGEEVAYLYPQYLDEYD